MEFHDEEPCARKFRQDVTLLIEIGDPATLDQFAKTVSALAVWKRQASRGGASSGEGSNVSDKAGRHEAQIVLFGECIENSCTICSKRNNEGRGRELSQSAFEARDELLRGLLSETDEWRAFTAYRMTSDGSAIDEISERLGVRIDEVQPLLDYARVLRKFCQNNPAEFWNWLGGFAR
ncbi:hypothetical protein DX908_07840 [Parvularcula marina]|uniref:Uncharacterized protein n=2 Tax=Parvularcula marina TaxID=2292771 RepID=A0A371RIA1_9PROT|nr:hypothetical protein DX908_07840 [Parvularcula marina]